MAAACSCVLKFVIWRLKILTRLKETFLSLSLASSSPHSSGSTSTSGGFFVCAITVVAKKKAEEDETKLSHYHAFRLSETTSLITLRSRVSLARWRRRRPDTVTTFNKCFLLHSYHAMVGSQRIPLERMEKKCISARVRSNADLTSEHDRTNDQKGTFRFRLVTIEA
jgi:hypothetical protein